MTPLGFVLFFCGIPTLDWMPILKWLPVGVMFLAIVAWTVYYSNLLIQEELAEFNPRTQRRVYQRQRAAWVKREKGL